jgi:hypothetical protein
MPIFANNTASELENMSEKGNKYAFKTSNRNGTQPVRNLHIQGVGVRLPAAPTGFSVQFPERPTHQINSDIYSP